MKYVALLRGINVGGKSTVKMSELKEVFEIAGFTDVLIYINSGNVIFDADQKDIKKITSDIDSLLINSFFAIKTIVISYKDLKEVSNNTPNTWKTEDLRKYIAFVKSPTMPEDVIKEAKLNPDVDFIEKGKGVIYMSTKMSGLTKSGFPKLIQKKVYQDITIRNYNTVQKLLNLIEPN